MEKQKQIAVKKIRENQALELELNEMDIRIALLVKNRISLDEVIKASKRQLRVVDDMELAHSMLKSLDKNSRRRLECYQQLFYLIQTRPEYLGKLLFAMNQSAINDRERRHIENMILTVFGFAQNAREEYFLLKLFKKTIEEEISYINSPSEFLRSSPGFIRLAVQYQRGAKERQYLRDLLQPLVKSVIDDPSIDLESDPLLARIALLNNY